MNISLNHWQVFKSDLFYSNMSGEYQGSQAYGAQPAGNETVNRNTGYGCFHSSLPSIWQAPPVLLLMRPLRCKEPYLLQHSSVGYSKSLIDLRGITPSINCVLDLTYSAGQSKSFGLPKNWTFSFPFLIPGKSVTTQQRTYIIDPDCRLTLLRFRRAMFKADYEPLILRGRWNRLPIGTQVHQWP